MNVVYRYFYRHFTTLKRYGIQGPTPWPIVGSLLEQFLRVCVFASWNQVHFVTTYAFIVWVRQWKCRLHCEPFHTVPDKHSPITYLYIPLPLTCLSPNISERWDSFNRLTQYHFVFTSHSVLKYICGNICM